MPTLRRSCEACVRAKRRCGLGTPSCRRCLARRLPCLYVNIPVSATSTARDMRLRQGGSVPQRNISRSSATKDQARGSRISNRTRYLMLCVHRPADLPIVRTLDQASTEYLVGVMRSFSTTFAQSRETLFLHPRLYGRASLPAPLRTIHRICALPRQAGRAFDVSLSQLLQGQASRLLRIGVQSHSFDELLVCVQGLVLVQSIRLFGADDSYRKDAERDNVGLRRLTHRLWRQAPTSLPLTMSLWQAWLVGESVRRTILVSYILQTSYCLHKDGFSVHTLFSETLPFDLRKNLWNLSTAEAWELAGAVPSPVLVSLGEYTHLWKQGRLGGGVSPFENLILAVCNGEEYLGPEVLRS